MSNKRFFNSKGEAKTLAELGGDMSRSEHRGAPLCAGSKSSMSREGRRSPRRRSRSPRRDRQSQGRLPHARVERKSDATPCPLSFAVFVKNKPMTEADSIVRDPDVAVEFARQIFPPEVQQSMIGRQDYEVFREGIHGAVKGLYTAYEVGMRLRAARREMAEKEARIRSLEARAEAAERELGTIKAAQAQPAGQVNPIVEERVTSRLISAAIADRDTASMFALESAKGRSYEKGFHEGRLVGIQKTKEKLAEEVCRCENRGFRHGWIRATQVAESLRLAGIDAASPRYREKDFPFSAFEVEKSEDEGDAV